MNSATNPHPDVLSITPRELSPGSVNASSVTVEYDALADTMFVYLTDDEIAPASVLLDANEDIYALVDPRSHDVLGFQLENFVSTALERHPVILPLAIRAGLESKVIASAIDRVMLDHPELASQVDLTASVVDFLARFLPTRTVAQ